MPSSVEIQQENQSTRLIVDFLIYFKDFRGISNRDLAQKIHYTENFLTNVRNGDKIGSEKLLHDLATFYLLDNLNRIQQIERQIVELQAQKTVLSGMTIEKFYAGRGQPVAGHGEKSDFDTSNDAANKSPSGFDAVSLSSAAAADFSEVLKAAKRATSKPRKGSK